MVLVAQISGFPISGFFILDISWWGEGEEAKQKQKYPNLYLDEILNILMFSLYFKFMLKNEVIKNI